MDLGGGRRSARPRLLVARGVPRRRAPAHGTQITSVEEAFGAVAAGVAVTCQGVSAVRAVGAGFPQLRFLPLRGAPPAQIAVAWRTASDSDAIREMVRTAIEAGRPPQD